MIHLALLPLLIAPRKRRPLPAKVAAQFANDYALGWLCKSETGYGWVTWGSSANLESALKVRDEVLARSGPREVLVWHESLPEQLTTDQIAQIRAAQSVH